MWKSVFQCFHCQEEGPKRDFQQCSQCSQAWYCSTACSRAHRKEHEPSCQAASLALGVIKNRRVVRGKTKMQADDAETDALCVMCQNKPKDPVQVQCLTNGFCLLVH